MRSLSRVPRDRAGSFEPVIVAKRQRRLSSMDEIVLSLYARGLTTGDIAAHFAEIYDAQVSNDTISRITDRVVEECRPGPAGRWSGSNPLLRLTFRRHQTLPTRRIRHRLLTHLPAVGAQIGMQPGRSVQPLRVVEHGRDGGVECGRRCRGVSGRSRHL